jgi:hypothetical protein
LHALTVLTAIERLPIEAAAALIEQPAPTALNDAWTARMTLHAALTDTPTGLPDPACDTPTRQQILDYADGLMPPDAALKLAARLAADEPLRAVALAQQEVAQWLQSALVALPDVPLAETLLPEPPAAAPPALPAARGRWREGAMGAALGLIVGIGGALIWTSQTPQASPLAVPADVSAALSNLETGASLALSAQQSVIMAASTIDASGRACRVVDLIEAGTPTRATACRTADGWVWSELSGGEIGAGDVSVASGSDQGPSSPRALGPAEEAALKARGWQPAKQP